jgi:hypothetical protein
VAAVVCCMLARPALAGEGDKAVARAHYETATRLYDVREYADALKEYKAAYIAKPDPAFLFNIGQCYRKMGSNAEALDFFRQYLKKAPPDDPNRPSVEARIRNIQSGLTSDYDPFDKSGDSTAQPSTPQAQQSLGPEPVPSSKPAFPPKSSQRPEVGSFTEPDLSAKHSPFAAEPNTQSPSQASPQLADSNLTATTPAKEASGPLPSVDLQTVKAPIAASPGDGWWLGRKWTWVAAGSTVVFVGIAAIAGSMMQSKYDDLRNSCGTAAGANWTGCRSSDVSSLDTRKNVANVFWGLSAAAAVTSGVLFFVEGHDVTVAPIAGGTAGLLANVSY